MAKQKIRTRPSIGQNLKINGVLNGRNTYVVFDGIGTLEGHKLYRLAKAIVQNFEPPTAAPVIVSAFDGPR